MTAPDFKPIAQRIYQSTTQSATGQLVASYTVQFVVGPHGPFTIEIPASEFSAEAVQKRMADFAAQVNQIPQE